MAFQLLGIGSTANDGTGDTLRVGGDKINDNLKELYAKINGVGTGSITDGTAITSEDIVRTTENQTITTKTINLASNTLSGTTAQFNTALSDDDFATLAGTETLASKTLTAPKIADGGFIADANGAEQIVFQTTASAVNEIEITNAATGGDASPTNGGSTAPIIGASGEANCDLALLPKGTGVVTIRSTTGANNQGQLRLNCEANSHGQVIVGQPHASSDSGYVMLPKTTAGATNVAGADILLSGDKTVGTTETVSGDGAGKDAISLDTLVTLLNTSGGTSDLTLATGVVGQVKVISMHTAGNAAVLDISDGNLAGMSTSITWDAVGESVTLLYNGTKWVVVGQFGVTIS